LIHLGKSRRAAHGLKRILVNVVELEEVSIRAWAHKLLGRALSKVDPSSSRRYLMRARHLYASIGYEVAMAECEIHLAQAEHRIGLNGRGRLRMLAKRSFADWPRLAAEMNVVRAEIEGEQQPDKARMVLLKARAFAIETGNRDLLRRTDAALREGGLADETQAEHLTPIDSFDPELAATIPNGGHLVPLARPEPFIIREASGRLTGRPRSSTRFVEREGPAAGRVALRLPRTAGVVV
jgi:hypothetical protein